MKFNKIAILLLSAGLLTTTSCDFMDCDESDNYTLQEIQGSYNRVKQFVTSIYGYLPSDFCNTHGIRIYSVLFIQLCFQQTSTAIHGLLFTT